MKIDIYKSIIHVNKYLSVPAGTDVEKHPFPKESFDTDLLKLSPFKTSLDINRGDKRIGLDSDKVISDIEQNGFAVHSSTMTVTVKVGK